MALSYSRSIWYLLKILHIQLPFHLMRFTIPTSEEEYSPRSVAPIHYLRKLFSDSKDYSDSQNESQGESSSSSDDQVNHRNNQQNGCNLPVNNSEDVPEAIERPVIHDSSNPTHQKQQVEDGVYITKSYQFAQQTKA